MVFGKLAVGNEQWEMGNRKWEIGNGKSVFYSLLRGNGVSETPCSLIFVFIFVSLVCTGCAKVKAASETKAAEEGTVFAVNTVKAAEGSLNDYIALSGDIIAGSSVDAYPEIAGKITNIFVSVGQRVTRGAALVEVDPSRAGMNYRRGVVTSPVSGTVTAIPVSIGATVSQQVAVARLSGGEALEVKLYVPERYISKIALNLPCEITLDAWPGETFRGTVKEVSPVVDVASRTMEVRVNVANQEGKLKAGMFAKVKLITEQKTNIVTIPAGSLLNRFGEDYVYVVVNNPSGAGSVAKKTAVTCGITVDGVLEVRAGLAPNDIVVTRGQTLLADGARVNMVD